MYCRSICMPNHTSRKCYVLLNDHGIPLLMTLTGLHTYVMLIISCCLPFSYEAISKREDTWVLPICRLR
ncbi:hypothetical protein CC77DRAFT_147575 [Alternaria alternata]|uniref:Uncharacterized protein n=1 Tax=Alternaria alternata TaxID=5599 RepID=A0A177DKY2_ALTAL|nr:hypothetical protein CC77DRAFT_147575 [Alternaria alternata]OAG19968.1 hypothetical protein CC77DRAFT_147575 [Alternaria alternata]